MSSSAARSTRTARPRSRRTHARRSAVTWHCATITGAITEADRPTADRRQPDEETLERLDVAVDAVDARAERGDQQPAPHAAERALVVLVQAEVGDEEVQRHGDGEEQAEDNAGLKTQRHGK